MDSVTKPPKNRVIKANRTTYAAKYNARVLHSLQSALATDPEADLSQYLSEHYTKTLSSSHRFGLASKQSNHRLPPKRDIRSRLDPECAANVQLSLSPELSKLLESYNNDMPRAIICLLEQSTVLYESAWAASIMVFRISDGLAVKITHQNSAVHEHHNLSWLQTHLPSFPAPRPHGVIKFSGYYLLFTTFVLGSSLESVWSQLDGPQKSLISRKIDELLLDLRSPPFPCNTPLGGIHGTGCKDGRQSVRTSAEPIISVEQFEDWIFAGSKSASPVYTQLLRDRLSALPSMKCVFTHGDLRPANIMVEKDSDGSWAVVAIIDWETSGFYPEYWECLKMTNCLTRRDLCDWYLHLPESVSMAKYSTHWLVDRVWDSCM